MKKVIVSRHPAAIDFIREEANLANDVPVIEMATEQDVRGKIVYGNLPMHLAALCHTVIAVEFEGTPPRGLEYSADDMRAAGAKLRAYKVEAAPQVVTPGKAWETIKTCCPRDQEGDILEDGSRVVSLYWYEEEGAHITYEY